MLTNLDFLRPGQKFPPAIEEALYSPVLHDTVITTEEMPDEVKRILGI